MKCKRWIHGFIPVAQMMKKTRVVDDFDCSSMGGMMLVLEGEFCIERNLGVQSAKWEWQFGEGSGREGERRVIAWGAGPGPE